MSLFSIIGLKPECYYDKIAVDFTAPFSLNKASNSIIPTFCKDKNYFTPAFILPRQKEYYSENTQFERTFFQERVLKVNTLLKELDNQNKYGNVLSQIAPDVKYCQICKTSFDSYFTHLQNHDHVTRSQDSKANQFIVQLCTNYTDNSKIKLKQKKKAISKRKKNDKKIKEENKKSFSTKQKQYTTYL